MAATSDPLASDALRGLGFVSPLVLSIGDDVPYPRAVGANALSSQPARQMPGRH